MTPPPRTGRTTDLRDPASMRALAHPTRMRLVGLLRDRGPQTAALLGDAVDEAPGTVSYHLGKLAAIGLIEQVEGHSTDRRERWWRATSDSTSWEPAAMLDDPEQLVASSALQKAIAQVYAAQFSRYVDTLPTFPREWVAASASSDRAVHLTAGQLAELRGDLEALAEKWDAVSQQQAGEPGTASVTLVYQAYRTPA